MSSSFDIFAPFICPCLCLFLWFCLCFCLCFVFVSVFDFVFVFVYFCFCLSRLGTTCLGRPISSNFHLKVKKLPSQSSKFEHLILRSGEASKIVIGNLALVQSQVKIKIEKLSIFPFLFWKKSPHARCVQNPIWQVVLAKWECRWKWKSQNIHKILFSGNRKLNWVTLISAEGAFHF